jgi:hypothetical protein
MTRLIADLLWRCVTYGLCAASVMVGASLGMRFIHWFREVLP